MKIRKPTISCVQLEAGWCATRQPDERPVHTMCDQYVFGGPIIVKKRRPTCARCKNRLEASDASFICDDCGEPVTEDQYDRGDGFCYDCASFHGVEESDDAM